MMEIKKYVRYDVRNASIKKLFMPNGSKLHIVMQTTVGGAVASWLVRSTQERAVRVRALAWDIALCSWARHFTLTVPLSTQVYKWVAANLMLGVTLRWTDIPSRGE